MLLKPVAILALTILSTTAVEAAQSGCPQHFLRGEQPAIVKESLAVGAKELCYLEFGVVHSGRTRTPLWVGEHLLAARIQASRDLEREDQFMAEESLHPDERSELSDYSRSGYDRGHVAPAADMSTAASMAESFTLANIVPQTAASNRGIWADVERSVRGMAIRSGELYVVSGPLFLSSTLSALRDRVIVPTHMFKAVYDPASGLASAYVVENDDDPQWGIVSIDDLAAMAGFDPFPAAPFTVKATASPLPRPGELEIADAGGTGYAHVPADASAIRDLDCSDFSGPLAVPPGDPHGLDADGDGIGCD